MLPIIFALITYFTWGSGDVLVAVGSRKIGAYSMSLWVVVFAILFSALYLPFAPASILSIDPYTFLLILSLGIINALAWYFFNRGLEIGNATLVGTIAATYSSLVVLFSITFLGESITLTQALAIALTLIGVVLVTLDFKTIKSGLKLDKGTISGILTMILWGIYFTLIKIPVQKVGWYWPGTIVVIVMAILYFAFMKTKKIQIKNPLIKGSKLLVPMASLLSVVGAFSLNHAFGIGQSSIVAPISGSYPTLYILLSYFVFRERVTKQ